MLEIMIWAAFSLTGLASFFWLVDAWLYITGRDYVGWDEEGVGVLVAAVVPILNIALLVFIVIILVIAAIGHSARKLRERAVTRRKKEDQTVLKFTDNLPPKWRDCFEKAVVGYIIITAALFTFEKLMYLAYRLLGVPND